MKLEVDGLNLKQLGELSDRLLELDVSFRFKCSYCDWPIEPYMKYTDRTDRTGYRHVPCNPKICVRAEDP